MADNGEVSLTFTRMAERCGQRHVLMVWKTCGKQLVKARLSDAAMAECRRLGVVLAQETVLCVNHESGCLLARTSDFRQLARLLGG